MSRRTDKENRKKGSPFVTILFFAALAVLLVSGYKLVTTMLGYKAGTDEYRGLEASFTTPYRGGAEYTEDTPDAGLPSDGTSGGPGAEAYLRRGEKPGVRMYDAAEEAAEPPISVDFDALREINPDIVGWIYVEAFPETISYPVLRGSDNAWYLHRTFRNAEVFSGSIFENYMNSADFSDPNTIIYGHNMKNQSMFGKLKQLKNQAVYDEAPYFWIITPQGAYRYRIYAVFDTPEDSEAYAQFAAHDETFLAWETRQQKNSVVKNTVTLSKDDRTVTLSTCTSNDTIRCVVMGRCISFVEPYAAAALSSVEKQE